MNIYIANLKPDFTDSDLNELFKDYGTINSAKIIYDKETKVSKGFGFVEMPNDEEGQKAIDELNGATLDDKVIKVSVALPPRQNGQQNQNRGFQRPQGGFNNGGQRRFNNNGGFRNNNGGYRNNNQGGFQRRGYNNNYNNQGGYRNYNQNQGEGQEDGFNQGYNQGYNQGGYNNNRYNNGYRQNRYNNNRGYNNNGYNNRYNNDRYNNNGGYNNDNYSNEGGNYERRQTNDSFTDESKYTDGNE